MVTANSIILPINTELLIRIFSKVHVSTELFYKGEPCWEWTGRLNDHGYGTIAFRRHPLSRLVIRAHRFVYEHFVEPIPNGLVLDHLCRNHHCVNPVHMEIVTHCENSLRGNGACAQHAKKTHCKYGHIFDEKNTGYTPKGRFCRECARQYDKKRYKELYQLPYLHPLRITARSKAAERKRKLHAKRQTNSQ